MQTTDAQTLNGSVRPVTRSKSMGATVFLRRVLRTRGAGYGLFITVLVILVALTADFISPYNPAEQDIEALFAAPSAAHLFGTDHIGRDILSRVIHGARPSLLAGLISVGFGGVIGTFMGLLAGFWGKYVDDLMMRIADALWSFPGLVLALAITASLGPGLFNAMLAIGVVFTPVFARLARASTLAVREREFIMAARAQGASDLRILRKHVLPNVMAPVIVQGSLMVAGGIMIEAALSFLGLGVQPPTPSWGSMLRDAYQFMRISMWPSFFPGIAIFVSVLGINMLGDGFRRALDPRLRGRGEA